MARIGYARVSSNEQDLTIQNERLLNSGCEIIRLEKQSGTSMTKREELKTILSFLRMGDVLVVTRIDRLALSVLDLQTIVADIKSKDAYLEIIDQPINTQTSAGKAFLDMLGVFAEFENNIRRERQIEGIAKAKIKGVYKGRRKSIDAVRVQELLKEGVRPTKVSEILGISRASVYRLKENIL
jgi:DNA invertase Pin-like site-specific DNA recombinase